MPHQYHIMLHGTLLVIVWHCMENMLVGDVKLYMVKRHCNDTKIYWSILMWMVETWDICFPHWYNKPSQCTPVILVAEEHHMTSDIMVNSGSCNDLLPDGNKISPVPALIYHQKILVATISQELNPLDVLRHWFPYSAFTGFVSISVPFYTIAS